MSGSSDSNSEPLSDLPSGPVFQSAHAIMIAVLVLLALLVLVVFSFLGITVCRYVVKIKKQKWKTKSSKRCSNIIVNLLKTLFITYSNYVNRCINKDSSPKDISENNICDSNNNTNNDQPDTESALQSGPKQQSAAEMTAEINHVQTVMDPSDNISIVMEPEDVVNARKTIEVGQQTVQGNDQSPADDDGDYDPYDSESYV